MLTQTQICCVTNTVLIHKINNPTMARNAPYYNKTTPPTPENNSNENPAVPIVFAAILFALLLFGIVGLILFTEIILNL